MGTRDTSFFGQFTAFDFIFLKVYIISNYKKNAVICHTKLFSLLPQKSINQ